MSSAFSLRGSSFIDKGQNPELYTKKLLTGLVRESEIVQGTRSHVVSPLYPSLFREGWLYDPGKLRALEDYETLLEKEIVAQFPELEVREIATMAKIAHQNQQQQQKTTKTTNNNNDNNMTPKTHEQLRSAPNTTSDIAASGAAPANLT